MGELIGNVSSANGQNSQTSNSKIITSNQAEAVEDLNIFDNLSKEEQQAVERLLGADAHLTASTGWLNQDGTVLADLSEMQEIINDNPDSYQLLENEETGETFVSIDSDGDGKFDRNATYENGKKTVESIDRDEDFNNELILKYDKDGKIKSGLIDENDDGQEEMVFNTDFEKFEKLQKEKLQKMEEMREKLKNTTELKPQEDDISTFGLPKPLK